jgi:enoyl-CoA hydratase
MAWTTLELTHDGPIAHVRLCRGDALNTMIEAFWTEMVEVFATIDASPATRVVVLSADGKHFTAGLDLAWAQSTLTPAAGDPARAREKFRRKIFSMQETMSVIDHCRVPVIAVVQGGCIGGGVDLVTACDLRVGTNDCYFTIQEINVGIVADVGTLQRLPYFLPQGLVRDLAYTGRKFTAQEAVHWGFLNRVAENADDALEAGLALAREIAAKTPLAITGIKQVLNHGRARTIEDGLEYVATWNAGMLMGEDLKKAVSAAMTKSIADYQDLLK